MSKQPVVHQNLKYPTIRARCFVSIRVLALGILVWVLGLFLNPFAKIQEVVAQQAKDDSPEVYQKVYQGWKWWHVYCFRCHGIDAFASNLAPNLRESVKVLTYDEFFKTARDGRVEKGMPAWNQLLTDEKIEQVYNYVLARSDEILPPGRPDEVKWSIPKDWPKARAAQKAPEGGATGQAVPGTR